MIISIFVVSSPPKSNQQTLGVQAVKILLSGRNWSVIPKASTRSAATFRAGYTPRDDQTDVRMKQRAIVSAIGRHEGQQKTMNDLLGGNPNPVDRRRRRNPIPPDLDAAPFQPRLFHKLTQGVRRKHPLMREIGITLDGT